MGIFSKDKIFWQFLTFAFFTCTLFLYQFNAQQPLLTALFFILILSMAYLLYKKEKNRQRIANELLLFKEATQNSNNATLIVDEKRTILYANESMQKATGYSEEELVGADLAMLKNKETSHSIHHDIQKHLTARETGKEILQKQRTYTMISLDLKENTQQQNAHYDSRHDSLTSLPNRLKLKEDMTHSIKLAQRGKNNLFVLFIDIDNFKTINETLGYSYGDEMLKITAKRVQSILESTDILARVGGDEFIAVTNTLEDKKSVELLCEKILNSTKRPIHIKSYTLTTSTSIGISMYPKDGADYLTLIKNAETSMNYAKKNGKNRYQYYSDKLSLHVHEQLKIQYSLQEAMSQNELFLHYQPQYNLKTGKIVAFEALAKWNSKELGFVAPDKFIPIAEETKMIIEIGKFIFETACRDFAKLQEMNENLEYIAINISSIQLSDENFTQNIQNISARYNLKPSQIELEITERYIMEYSQNNLQILQALKELGFRFSIDDFGTGYSSMSYLANFPIHAIKIDRSFLAGIPNNHKNIQIIKAITMLAKSLNCRIVAEGIELKEQEDYLRLIDCDLGQGYLFSKPLTFDDTINFLIEKSL